MYYWKNEEKYNLQGKFEKFCRRIELNKQQKQRIISSHRHLRQNCLDKLSMVRGSFLTGSYKKKTMIRPVDDVDIFLELDIDVDGVSPRAVFRRLKAQIDRFYPNSIVRNSKPCIVLKLNHCTFDLTPAVKYSDWFDSGYYIPGSTATSWIDVSDPRDLEGDLSKSNSRLNGRLVPLIKVMKACQRFRKHRNLKSYELEELAIDHISNISSFRQGVTELLDAYDWIGWLEFLKIRRLSDEQFAHYCRNELFGKEFPV